MKHYPEEFKQQVLETLATETLARASKLHHVGECTIRRWKKQAEAAQRAEKSSENEKKEQESRRLDLILDDMFAPAQSDVPPGTHPERKEEPSEKCIEPQQTTQIVPMRPVAIEGEKTDYPVGPDRFSVASDAVALLREQYQSLQRENRRLRRALLAMLEDYGIQP